MSAFTSKCLICLVKVEPESKCKKDSDGEELTHFHLGIEEEQSFKETNQSNHDESSFIRTSSILQRQLDVIFLLRNILQLPPSQLRKYLKVRGNPEGWVVLCGSCEELLSNAKETFLQLQRISKKFDKARKMIEKRIKATYWIDKANSETNADFILDECRKTVCKRKTTSKKINFSQGDQRAHQLLVNCGQLNVKTRGNDDETDVDFNDPKTARTQISSPFQPWCFDNQEEPEMPNSPLEIDGDDPLSDCGAPDDTHSITSSSRYEPSGNSNQASSDSEADNDKTVRYSLRRSLSQLKRKGSEADEVISDKKKKTKVQGKGDTEDPDPDEKAKLMILTCRFCRRGFSSQEKYALHKEKCPSPKAESESEEPVTCPECHKVLKNAHGLKVHLIKIHGIQQREVKSYPCKIEGCGKIFQKKKHLNKHMEIHPKEERPTCTICKKDFRDKYNYDRHAFLIHRIVKPNTIKMKLYECPKCEKRFISEKYQKFHSDACQGIKVEEPQVCEICKVKCANSKDLRIHKKFKHSIKIEEESEDEEEDKLPEPEANFPCPFCGKFFITEAKMEVHMGKIHENKKPPPTCSLCPDRKFGQQSQLDRHNARYHNIGTEEFKCLLCDTFCKSRVMRRRHVCGIPDRTRYGCHQCGKDYYTRSALRTHITYAHEKQLNIFCDLCDFRTYLEQELRRHKATKHNIGIKCEVEGCPRFFTRVKLMEAHVKKIHRQEERERSFLCTECGKGFFDERVLKNHQKAVHLSDGSKPYRCKLCGMGFATANYCRIHMNRVHFKKKTKVKAKIPPSGDTWNE